MWAQITIDPVKLRRLFAVLHHLFLSVMLLAYGTIDIIEWSMSKLQARKKKETNELTPEISFDFEKPTCQNSSSRNLEYWMNLKPYQQYKVIECSISNAIVEILLTCFWTAHLVVCCKTYQQLSGEEKTMCIRWTRAKCYEIYTMVKTAEMFSRLAPSVLCLMQDICETSEESLAQFFDAFTAHCTSREPYWLAIYSHCRLRSKLAEKGMFPASVAVHTAFARCDKESSNIYGNLFSIEYRRRISITHPLAFFTCEKCVYPYHGNDLVSSVNPSELLERTLHVICDGTFRRQVALQLDRSSYSYRDNLTIDLSLNTKLGFLVSEWPITTLERLLWIAEKGGKHMSVDFWSSLKNMRKKLVVDLRKTDVQMLINYSLAGVVFLDGKSDSFFRLIGNEDAPVRLRGYLPKPKFDDILKTELAKPCGDGTFTMCQIPGVEGNYKGIHVGGSLLFVKCSERAVVFHANRWQNVL